MTEIDEGLFNELWDIYNDATDKGFAPSPSEGAWAFYNQLKYNNGVFAAFKTHRMQNDMASQLLDEDGKLKSFSAWEADTRNIRDHHVKNWLETEYNTAVKRAHMAADWQQFEREKDILPNLEWVKSTSVTPGEDHRQFWGTILPVDDPFWNNHRPGDRWNCKCGLRSTDKPIVHPPKYNNPIDNPAKGLENNPGKDAMLFSFSHPYFALAYMTYKKLAPIIKKFVDKQIAERKKLKEFKKDNVAGKKLLIHKNADPVELEDNKKTGRTLVENFPKMKVVIREHIRKESGPKNPEYEINGMIADGKRIKSTKGITAGFVTAKEQRCEVVIIDFDKHLLGKEVNRIDVARRIGWRRGDFDSGVIKECYIVHNGRAIKITKKNFDKREWIIEQLKKSGM